MLQPTAVQVLALILHLHSESPRGMLSRCAIDLNLEGAQVWLCLWWWLERFDQLFFNDRFTLINMCWFGWFLRKPACRTFFQLRVFFILMWPKGLEAKIDRGVAQTWLVVCSFTVRWFKTVLAAGLVLAMLLEVLLLGALVPGWREPGREGEGCHWGPLCRLHLSYL